MTHKKQETDNLVRSLREWPPDEATALAAADDIELLECLVTLLTEDLAILQGRPVEVVRHRYDWLVQHTLRNASRNGRE